MKLFVTLMSGIRSSSNSAIWGHCGRFDLPMPFKRNVNSHRLRRDVPKDDNSKAVLCSACNPDHGAEAQRWITQFVEGTAAFLDDCTADCAALKDREKQLVDEVLMECDSEVKIHVEQTFLAVAEASAELISKAEDGSPLPLERLHELNVAIQLSEQRYQPAKSDVIPDTLLNAAEPGARLYPNLVRKVKLICNREYSQWEHRLVEQFRARLLQGGFHEWLDKELAQLRLEHVHKRKLLFGKHAGALSYSDHAQIRVLVPFGAGEDTVLVSSWNVMELPQVGSKVPVLDGVNPTCDLLLRALRRKGVESRQVLQDAFSSEVVIERHIERVLEFIQDSIQVHGSDYVLLQELGSDVQKRISELCNTMGWTSHFSGKCEDPSKCDAITAIVSKRVFDDVAELEVVRAKKTRRFAAARHGKTWVVSCHMPLSLTKNNRKDADLFTGNFELQVLGQLWNRFGHSNETDVNCDVLAGGDWNAPLRDLIKLVAVDMPEGCGSVALYAPASTTTLYHRLYSKASSPIDGVICLKTQASAEKPASRKRTNEHFVKAEMGSAQTGIQEKATDVRSLRQEPPSELRGIQLKSFVPSLLALVSFTCALLSLSRFNRCLITEWGLRTPLVHV